MFTSANSGVVELFSLSILKTVPIVANMIMAKIHQPKKLNQFMFLASLLHRLSLIHI